MLPDQDTRAKCRCGRCWQNDCTGCVCDHKTREEMIEDAAQALARTHGDRLGRDWSKIAADALDAALAPRKPAYPTQESIDAAKQRCPQAGLIDQNWSDALVAADEHNPIMQAAVEAARVALDTSDEAGRNAALGRLRLAVKDAGKL